MSSLPKSSGPESHFRLCLDERQLPNGTDQTGFNESRRAEECVPLMLMTDTEIHLPAHKRRNINVLLITLSNSCHCLPIRSLSTHLLLNLHLRKTPSLLSLSLSRHTIKYPFATMRQIWLSITIWTAVLFLLTSAEQPLSSEINRGRFKRSIVPSIPRSGSAKHVETSWRLNDRALDDGLPDGASENTAELQKFKIKYEEIPFKLDEAWTKLEHTKGFSLRGEKWFSTGKGIVYPAELMKQNKGLWPRNYDPTTGKPKPFPEAGRGSDEFKSTSLWEHVNGQTKSTTRWMSMTKSVHKSIEFSANWENGKPSKVLTQPEGRDGLDLNVIWKIQDAPNVVDTHGSLANKGANGEFVSNEKFVPSDYLDQVEYSAFEGIPTEQIKGYFRTELILRNPGLAEKIANGEEPEGVFVKNIDYNDKFDSLSHAGARPDLAGFPPVGIDQGTMKKEGWERQPFELEPWNKFDQGPQGEAEGQKIQRRVQSHKDRARDFEDKSEREILASVCSTNLRKRAGSLCNSDTSAPAPGNDRPEPGKPIEDEVKPTNPNEEELPKAIDDAKGVELTRKTSDDVFSDLFSSQKMGEKAAKLGVKAGEARTRLSGYELITAESPKLKLSGVKLAGEGAGVALWVTGMVQAFTSHTTGLQRAAAVTAIIPFVGCGFSALAEADSEEGVDVIDKMMCIYADILLLTPLAPFSFVIQVFRGIMSLYKPKALPKAEDVQDNRDKRWARFLDDRVFTYFYSDDSVSNNRVFRDKLNGTLFADHLGVVSDAADFIAIANTSARVALQAQNADKPKIQAGALDVANQITAEISPMIVRRQREFLLKLPQLVLRDTKLSLQPIAEQFNKELIEHMTSEAMVRQYTPLVPAIDGQPLGDEENLKDQTRGSLHAIGEHLKKNPPPLPRLFDIAYVLGQSKGMLDVNPLSLSPGEFIKSRAPDLSQDDVDFYSLHHALQISLLLRGKLTEDKLSKLWPSDDASTVQQLQLLLALKFGKIYDEQKVLWVKSQSGVTGNFLGEKEVRWSTHPNIPPHGRDEESMAYLGLILDLSEERIKNIPRHKEVIGFKDLGTDAKLITAMLEHAKELYIKTVDEEAVAMQDDKANDGEKDKGA